MKCESNSYHGKRSEGTQGGKCFCFICQRFDDRCYGICTMGLGCLHCVLALMGKAYWEKPVTYSTNDDLLLNGLRAEIPFV